METRVSCNEDDDLPPQTTTVQTYNETAEVKRKPICPSFHVLILFIIGVICILLGLIDMIIFYVIPNNKINDNKKKYPTFTFNKPDSGIIALHFLLHISLIALGAVLVATINPKFFESFDFTFILIVLLTIFGVFYFVHALYSGLVIKQIKKEDLKLSEVIKKLNNSIPISSVFFFISGSKRVAKANYKTCYSKNGFVIPVTSKTNSNPYFFNENYPDYFYFEYSQKMTTSLQIFQWISIIKERIKFCQNSYTVVTEYQPTITGENLVLKDGKKIEAKMKKPSAIASVIFGLAVYPEMLEKSIPIKKVEIEAFIDVDPNINYTSLYESVDCNYIGSCQTSNSKPVP